MKKIILIMATMIILSSSVYAAGIVSANQIYQNGNMCIDSSGGTITGNLTQTGRNMVTGTIEIVDTVVWDVNDSTQEFNKNILLRSEGESTGGAIAYTAHPTSINRSYLVGEDTFHGVNSGVGKFEMARYIVINDSALNYPQMNCYKVFSQLESENDAALTLTTCDKINVANGETLHLGAGTTGSPYNSTVQFWKHAKFFNDQALYWDDNTATDRKTMFMDSNNDLYIDNQATYATTPYMRFRSRDSGNTLRERMTLGIEDYGTAWSVRIKDVLNINPRDVAPTSPINGDIYIDSTGSDTACVYLSGTWEVMAGSGSCA